VAAKIHKEKLRVTHLLNVIGKDAQDLYKTFTLINDTLPRLLQPLEAHCIPEINVIYEHYMFNRCVQEPGETIDHFITTVIKLAESCQYGGLRDDLIRDIRNMTK